MSLEELKNSKPSSSPAQPEVTNTQLEYSQDSSEGLNYKAQFPHINEAKVLRKIDIRVVPVLCLLYLLAFLDRVNISNAAIFGLKEDLELKGNEYNTALVIFFVPYILLEIPSNCLLKRFKPHVWLSGCMFVFGMVTTLQGFTQNYSGILATRFFLGVAESGVFPGCLYLITMWYKREEAQKRCTFFVSSTTLAGAFGGLLASAIGKMDGIRGYSGWRWVFILEGVLTCIVSVILFFLISDFPEDAMWLSAEEKAFVKARLYDDIGESGRTENMTFKAVLDIFKDYKFIAGGVMYLGLVVPGYSYAYFAPAVISGLGHSSIRTQLLSVPPWACAFILSMAIAVASDAFRHHFMFALVPIALAVAGFAILLVAHNNTTLEYGALFLAAMGIYSSLPVMACWFNTNIGGHHRRSVATGWQIGFGNVGGIIAAYSFLSTDAPRYTSGFSICTAFTGVAALSCCLYFAGLVIENSRRDRGLAAGAHLSHAEKSKMGDLNPDYRYLL